MRSRTNKNLRLCACQVKDEYRQRRSILEVKDEQIRLSLYAWAQGRTDEQHFRYLLGAECGREMVSNATWRETWNPRLTRLIGLVGAAAMRELHVIQGPNYAWCAWKIAFCAFHTFLVEESWIWAKKESGPNYTISAHAFIKAILRLGMLASFVAHNKRLKSRNRSNVSEKVNTWLHGNVLHDKAGYTCDTLKKFAHAR